MWIEWYLFVGTVRKKYLKYKTKYTCIGRDEQWNNKLDDFSEKQKKMSPCFIVNNVYVIVAIHRRRAGEIVAYINDNGISYNVYFS